MTLKVNYGYFSSVGGIAGNGCTSDVQRLGSVGGDAWLAESFTFKKNKKMQVDFDKLRESIRINFNDLCTIASDAKFRYDEEFLLVDPQGLQIAIDDLRNDVVTLLSLVNPESGKFIEGDIEVFDLASTEVES